MKNPIRRNRNIGTKKQGHGKDNEQVIPYPLSVMKSFVERLKKYTTVVKMVNGYQFMFIIEKTRKDTIHACTVEDLVEMLGLIPSKDYGEVPLIILRQPTRKEEKLNAVWGRLIYFYEFEDEIYPAIIIEAVDINRKLKWSKKLDMDAQEELKRLELDGHDIRMNKRYYEAAYDLFAIRNTQLYRTLLHEFGHYVHYLEIVERPEDEDEPIEKWEKRLALYDQIPSKEKETFAHTYADDLKKALEEKGLIPFERKLNEDFIIDNKLDINDFCYTQVEGLLHGY